MMLDPGEVYGERCGGQIIEIAKMNIPSVNVNYSTIFLILLYQHRPETPVVLRDVLPVLHRLSACVDSRRLAGLLTPN
jgi:hypothetical protein